MLFFAFLGFVYNGFPKIKNPYWIYLIVLLPSVFLSFLFLDGDLKRKIFFEILGPICLGVLALYTYGRKISAREITIILNAIALPILASCAYLILRYSHNFYPICSNCSNFYFSGGYAPNQMATALGLGVFIYLLKILSESENGKMFYPNIIILGLLFHRALLTFSRGGIIAALIAVLILCVSLYISRKGCKLKIKIGLSLVIITAVFMFTDYQTETNLFKRYTNFNLFHTKNTHKPKGRYIQIKSDIKNFAENPLLGIGSGKGKEIRKIEYNINVSTHSEITRLMSEHGVLGLLALLILVYYPIRLYFNNLGNFYLLPFFIFWLFTINHSATRIIAPLFLYTLALMKIEFEMEENGMVKK
ncbi:MAG: O-antigen ligase family protein [Flavobacterium sp.]|nr:O-antigen ligase family protein [Flavobacterium sp.]